jgi:hypothetical protein
MKKIQKFGRQKLSIFPTKQRKPHQNRMENSEMAAVSFGPLLNETPCKMEGTTVYVFAYKYCVT